MQVWAVQSINKYLTRHCARYRDWVSTGKLALSWADQLKEDRTRLLFEKVRQSEPSGTQVWPGLEKSQRFWSWTDPGPGQL